MLSCLLLIIFYFVLIEANKNVDNSHVETKVFFISLFHNLHLLAAVVGFFLGLQKFEKVMKGIYEFQLSIV